MRSFSLIILMIASGYLPGQHILAMANTPAATDTIYGDLDADGVNERIVRYDFAAPVVVEVDPEVLAQVVVYRLVQGEWTEWPAARGSLLYAYDEVDFARMSVAVERGALVISHYKTGYFNHVYTRRFRWQNGRFELIGATVAEYGRCEYEHKLDYNLSTGRFTYEEYEVSCDEVQIDEDYFQIEGRAKRPRPILLSKFENNTYTVGLAGGDQHYF